MTVSIPEALYTVPDVARAVGCSRAHAYLLIKRKELHAERDESNQLRVSRDEVVAHLVRNRQQDS